MFNKRRIHLIIFLLCLSALFSVSYTIVELSFFQNDRVKANSKISDSALISPQPYKSMALANKNINIKQNFNKYTQNIYLTFDDGPNQHTKKILHILKRKKTTATFFMLNDNILKNKEMVAAVNKAGNSLGCHGVSHRVDRFYQTKKSPLVEMNTCKKSILKASGEETLLIRVPYGSFPNLSPIQKKYLDHAGFIMWDWNVDSEDWLNKNKSGKYLVNHVVNQVKQLKKHDITPVILLHDTEISVKALPKLIDKLQAMGYTFQPINEQIKPLQFSPKN
ncbi:polysaccharide deacetylase family protein [Bacillus massilinigeriensis]|uniref:polysaccharide deacetylase family protein n=1 Tax=Bacillus massilionigeriensis TaxID=1805475 RepID=UPI00096B1A74|nr:polysaccharide deacetylase family protein [Bacillus massilionigeriensis]